MKILISVCFEPDLFFERPVLRHLQTGKTVTVPHHKSTHVVLSGKAAKVSLGDPEVLDIVILKSNELFSNW